MSRRLNAGFELFSHGHGCLALGRRGGGARNGTDSYALRQGCHAIGRGGHRIQKAQYHWPWAVGAGVVGTVGGGMGTGSEREGGGVFFTADLC